MSMKEIAMTGRMWENVGKTVQLWLQALCSCSTPFCKSVFCTIYLRPAFDVAVTELPLIHPIRLGLALNFSVF